MLYKIAPYLPIPVRKAIRQARSRTEGLFSYLTALRSDGEIRRYAAENNLPLPPLSARRLVGGGHYFEFGENFVRNFIDLCDLKPGETVLDVGCGYGRMAVPLTRYLSKNARYEGFDIVGKGIRWCQENITSSYPNFAFQHSDVFNGFYNPHGRYKASEYRFPYESDTFDFIFLNSVFTHMLPGDLEHYLSEISRVLKPGARCLITYFLLNDEVREHIRQGQSAIAFTKERQGCWVTERDQAEGAVAYEQSTIYELHRNYGVPIREPVHYGGWSTKKGLVGRTW